MQSGRVAAICWVQAILVLRWFKDDTKVHLLAWDAGVSQATAYRYLHEAVDVIAERAPEISQVLDHGLEHGWEFVCLDGTLVETTRTSAGDKAETTTIIPITKAFAARHDLVDMVVVADAGMLSGTNLAQLDKANLRFIVGSRAVKAPLDLSSHFRWHGDAFSDAQVIDTLTPRTGRKSENDPKLRAEPSWDPVAHPGSWRAVWAYSRNRAVRDDKTLTLQENRARAVIAGEKAARSPRFVATSNGARTLDEASLARARRLVGLKGYVTNIPAPLMPAGEVLASYHDLWNVEASFRMSKTDLRARPMFHHTRDAIEAHLSIVFTALAVSREVQARTGLAIRNVLRQLRPLRSATIAINGTTQVFAPAVPVEQQAILDAIHGTKVTH